MPSSREGLYELLVTRAVERWLADLDGLTSEIKEADTGELSLRLTRHVAQEAAHGLPFGAAGELVDAGEIAGIRARQPERRQFCLPRLQDRVREA